MGGRRRVGEENLDFSPDGVGQPRFSLAPEPPSAPSAPGSACGRRAEKRAEPALFVILGARLGRFFGAGAEKVAWRGPLGARLEMLLEHLHSFGPPAHRPAPFRAST